MYASYAVKRSHVSSTATSQRIGGFVVFMYGRFS